MSLPALPSLPFHHPRKLRHLLPPIPCPPNQPICQIQNPTRFLRAPAFLGMLDRMRRYPSFLIELEDEEPAKRFVSFAEARGVGEPFREAVDLFTRADAAV